MTLDFQGNPNFQCDRQNRFRVTLSLSVESPTLTYDTTYPYLYILYSTLRYELWK